MALLEMQLPTKADFNNDIRSDATNFNNLDHRTADTAEFLEEFTGAVLTTLGVPAGDQSAYADYRTMLIEFQTWLAGDYSEQTIVPRVVIDKFRRMR